MNEKYNVCDIVLDLLPLYIEQRTCKESDIYIENHLEVCEECKEVYHLMREDLSLQLNKCDSRKNENKHRRKHWRRILAKILLVLLGIIGYACLMIGIIVWVFLYLDGI